MVDERVGGSFWLSEFLRSDVAVRRGIDNMPAGSVLQLVRGVLGPGMQRVRNALGVPVLITSGYRSPALNAAIGGARNSAHTLGLAADFIAPVFGTPKSIARYLMERSGEIRFEQLIWEGTWCHIAFPADGRAPKGEVLTAHFDGAGRVTYSRGLG
jgi:hypothetical protein